jgi:putative heme-binding domain-containing protein
MFVHSRIGFGLVVAGAGLAAILFGARARSAAEPTAAVSTDPVLAHRQALREFALSYRGGSVEAGRKLFFDRSGPSCISCHRVNGSGGQRAPDLGDVGARQSVAELIDSVLEPSRQIARGYQRVTVQTADGRTITGLLKEETPQYLTVRSGTEMVRIERDEVESLRRDEVSDMPEGLADDLTPVQFADLIAYLASLRGTEHPVDHRE